MVERKRKGKREKTNTLAHQMYKSATDGQVVARGSAVHTWPFFQHMPLVFTRLQPSRRSIGWGCCNKTIVECCSCFSDGLNDGSRQSDFFLFQPVSAIETLL